MTEAATIGHNSAAVGEMLAENPNLLFTETGMLESLLDEVKAEIAALTPDVSTETGRKAIASLAYSIARRKTPLDDAGKALNEDHRKAINEVDAIRRKMRDELDALKIKARKPLTEWEEAEDARKATVTNTRLLFAAAMTFRGEIADVEAKRQDVIGANLSADTFGDMLETALSEQSAAIEALDSEIARLKQEQADREELDRLRAEKAAAEQAAADAERKRREEEAEQARIDAAAQEAAQRAADEAERKAQAEIDAANKAAAEAQAELDRQAKQKADDERAAAEREADIAHRSSVMRSAKEALMETAGISETAAKKAVLAIASGSIPNVTLRF